MRTAEDLFEELLAAREERARLVVLLNSKQARYDAMLLVQRITCMLKQKRLGWSRNSLDSIPPAYSAARIEIEEMKEQILYLDIRVGQLEDMYAQAFLDI